MSQYYLTFDLSSPIKSQFILSEMVLFRCLLLFVTKVYGLCETIATKWRQRAETKREKEE